MQINSFNCRILFNLSASSKIALSKDSILEIIEFKISEKSKKFKFTATLPSILFPIRSFKNIVILENSDRSNEIVELNGYRDL